MGEWDCTVTIFGARTGVVLSSAQFVFNVDDEGDAIDEAIEKTLSSFNFPGTKTIKVHVIKAGA